MSALCKKSETYVSTSNVREQLPFGLEVWRLPTRVHRTVSECRSQGAAAGFCMLTPMQLAKPTGIVRLD
jgi:hypothetical protein